ncbi:MAG: hypothetical protein WCI38_00655, partial [Chthoniobacterales bacterium]
LKQSVVDKYFTGTATRIEGSDMEGIAAEVIERHHDAYLGRGDNGPTLEVGGDYQWRSEGEAPTR